jgi:pyruvate dehydrogenase E2 component (dihydrolipoamide acetyltransferase)
MPVEVILPKVDMDMETGVIIEWKVVDGARVRPGDILFDIETSKSVMEVESPGAGIIRKLAPITGEPIAVGTAVAWIYGENEAEPAPQPAPDAPAPRGEVRASPAARRIARELNVDLTTISGSGPGGRIVEDDVTAAATKGQPAAAALPLAAEAGKEDRLVPFNPVRRIVAERLAESMRTVPHFYLTAQIDMTALRALQRRIGAEMVQATGSKASLTVLIAHIVGRVLVDHPYLNASSDGNAARLHPTIHIGIAIDRAGDLIVPVLRDVQARTLRELVRDFVALRNEARSGSIRPAQMRGGTFTISNLGMYGVDAFTAIINPPECAILAIGRTVDTPVGREGQIVLRPMATFTLSSDHRIVDGVTAARFMADLRKAIETADVAV